MRARAAEWHIDSGKPAELHVYATGGHGFGMMKRNSPVDTWIERFGEWMHYMRF